MIRTQRVMARFLSNFDKETPYTTNSKTEMRVIIGLAQHNDTVRYEESIDNPGTLIAWVEGE